MNLKRKILTLFISLCCCFGISLSLTKATDDNLDVTSVEDPVVSEDGQTWKLVIHFNQTLDTKDQNLGVGATIISLDNYNTVICEEKIDMEGNTLTLTLDVDSAELAGYWHDGYHDGYIDDLKQIPAGDYILDILEVFEKVPGKYGGYEYIYLFTHDAENRYKAVPNSGVILENNPNPYLKDITVTVDENGRFVQPKQPNEPDKDVVEAPKMIEGNNVQWNEETSKDLSFKSDADFDTFVKVTVDSKDVDSSFYTVKEGSTIVTLKESYLKTLTEGKHTIGIVSENGVAQAEFTILAKTTTSDKPQSITKTEPQTTKTESQTTTSETTNSTDSQSTEVKTPVKTGDTISVISYVLLASCAMGIYITLKKRENM